MIYVLGGIHCDKNLYRQIIEILKEAKPDLVCLEELTHDREMISACDKFIEGEISKDEFKRHTKFEELWFDFTPYEEFFSYLSKKKIRIYPIDHGMKKRMQLIQLEQKILERLREGGDISGFKEKEEKMSVFGREKAMVGNIIKGIKKFKSKDTFVIVGINHSQRIEKSLRNLGYKVAKTDISTKKDIDNYLARIYKYAIENKIENLKLPPLVPIFVLVFKALKKKPI